MSDKDPDRWKSNMRFLERGEWWNQVYNRKCQASFGVDGWEFARMYYAGEIDENEANNHSNAMSCLMMMPYDVRWYYKTIYNKGE